MRASIDALTASDRASHRNEPLALAVRCLGPRAGPPVPPCQGKPGGVASPSPGATWGMSGEMVLRSAKNMFYLLAWEPFGTRFPQLAIPIHAAKEALGIFNTAGISIGALSIFYLFSDLLKLNISAMMQNIGQTYKWLAHELLLDPVLVMLGLQVPSWGKDLLVFWLVMSAVCARTLSRARFYCREYLPRDLFSLPLVEGECQQNVDAPDDDTTVRLGAFEKLFFALPDVLFYVLAFLMSVLMWPVFFMRFIYGKRRVNLLIPLLGFRTTVAMSFPPELDPHYNYRAIWFTQLFAMSIVIILLFVTNAGLPAPS